MARLARVVVPGLAYHVTHRGNRGTPIFFQARDREIYLHWLAEYSLRHGLRVFAYCLMTNHVHLLVEARNSDSMALAIGRSHRRYARRINALRGWTGHLWGNRFHSTPLDARHLWTAVRYVELNPVRAGIVDDPVEYPWSSAQANATGSLTPPLCDSRPFPGPVEDWLSWLLEGLETPDEEFLRLKTSTGRPCGSDDFVRSLENRLCRTLKPEIAGRKPRNR